MAKNPFEKKMAMAGDRAKAKVVSSRMRRDPLKALENWRPPTRDVLAERGEYEEARAHNEEALSGYADDVRLVASSNHDDEPFEATAGELRCELVFMEDEEKGRAHGWPYYLFIESEDPEKFFEIERKQRELKKNRHLDKLSEYADDQLIWVVYPNQGANCHKTTAGEMRRMLETYDRSIDDYLSHAGGFKVVSTDPAFDPVAYERKNNEMFEKMVECAAAYVQAGSDLKDALIKRLHHFEPTARFRVTYADEAEGRLLTGAELEQEIFSMSSKALEARGILVVEPMALYKEPRKLAK